MSGNIEYSKCEVCGKEAPLQRTYWHYLIKCECHSPSHFEMVRHCSSCVPKEPITTTATMLTNTITKGRLSHDSEKQIDEDNGEIDKNAIMKILFVINNSLGTYLEYEHTGILNTPNRRAVEIDLTPEQIKKIGLRKIGVNCGEDLMETIESISLTNQEIDENE